MKNLFTLFLTALTALSFAQQAPMLRPVKYYKVAPNTPSPKEIHIRHSASRTSTSCDTADVLDYSTYNELVANNLQISFNGSWNSASPSIAAAEVTSSFVTLHSYDNSDITFVETAFDTLAFANFTNANLYSMSMGSSTVTLDSLGMFIGVYGDTVSAHGTMTNDSLVFKIYSIAPGGLIGTTPVKTVSFVGYAGLAPFLVGPQYLHYASIQVGQSFAQGQGFAVKMNYYNSDTSSHCLFSYTYPDSCQTVTIQGQQYTSPAYPSTFVGSAQLGAGNFGSDFYGQIDSTGPTTTGVTIVSNDEYYNLSSYGIPKTCSFVYNQNWEFLAFVTVTNTLGIAINGSNPLQLACPTSSHALTTTRTGDLAGAVYTWSSNVTGSTSTGNTSIRYPGTYSVTVTNTLGCSATDAITAVYANGANITPSFTVKICANWSAAITNTSNATGYSANWTYGQGVDSTTSTTASVYTYTAFGSYPVTMVLDSAGCTFGVTQTVNVLDCTGFNNVAFENGVSIVPNPSNGNINITVNGVEKNINITVYNTIGETVRSFGSTESPAIFNKAIDLNNLANGTYLVRIQSGDKVATKKLVIAK